MAGGLGPGRGGAWFGGALTQPFNFLLEAIAGFGKTSWLSRDRWDFLLTV